MLYNIEFNLAVFHVLELLDSSESRYYTVKEVAERYLLEYPCDIEKAYKNGVFRKRIRDSLCTYVRLKKVENKRSIHKVYNSIFYSFKLIKQ